MNPSRLDADSLSRYSRQILVPGFGEESQRRLALSSVLLVGVGGLGSAAAPYLAAAGVGRIGLVDDDRVESTNLHRQVLYTENEVGEDKLDAAAERLRAMRHEMKIALHRELFTPDNARELVRGYDLVLDGTDNFAARYAVNDASVLEGRPNVHAGVQGVGGYVTVLGDPRGPCYRCLFPEVPEAGSFPSCAEAGVLGPVAGLVGLWQALEAVKILAGFGTPMVSRMLRIDAEAGGAQEIALRRDPTCPLCGEHPTITDVEGVGAACEVPEAVARPTPSGADAVFDPEDPVMSVEELGRRLADGSPPVVLDVRLPEELDLVRLRSESIHIPLHLLPLRLAELDPDQEYAVLCHQGIRSFQAVQFLRGRGFRRARNLEGGIDRYAIAVDPSLPRY